MAMFTYTRPEIVTVNSGEHYGRNQNHVLTGTIICNLQCLINIDNNQEHFTSKNYFYMKLCFHPTPFIIDSFPTKKGDAKKSLYKYASLIILIIYLNEDTKMT